MSAADRKQRDWVLNGCIYFHMHYENDKEVFTCDKTNRKPEYEFCAVKCKQRVKHTNWVI